MKKTIMRSALLSVVGIGLMAGNASAATYTFEDKIDDWVVGGHTYGSVYIDEDVDWSNLLVPNTVEGPFTYTHDINDDVDFIAGDTVTEAWLELDFVNFDGLLGMEGDAHGSFWKFSWDAREFVQYTYDAGTSSWVEISEDNDVQTVVLSVDWLNADGLLDVTINLTNNDGDADLGLDHSRLYGTATTAPVPEPATMLLFGTGVVGLVGMRRKKIATT